MPRNYDTTGKLVGNTPENLTGATPANRVGGYLPGTAQPTGTKFMAYGESGTSDAFNRAFAGVSAQNDLQQMTLSQPNVVPCTFDYTILNAAAGPGLGLDMSAAGGATIDIDTSAAGVMYAYIGMVKDLTLHGMPFNVSHNPAHAVRANARVRQVFDTVTYDAAPMFAAASTVSTTLALPTEVAPLANLQSSLAAAGSTFNRDSISGVTWANYHALPGAFIRVSDVLNRGWYQIASIDAAGTTATLMKNAAKRIPAGTFVDGGAPAWTGHLGTLFTTPGGQGFYVFDVDTANGWVYVHTFTGPNWAAGSVNDIYALTDGLVLTNAASGDSFAVDFTGRAIEDVGEPLVMDTGAGTGTYDIYCPPGFVPMGTSGTHACTIDFTAALDNAGGATDRYFLNIGIHAPTEDIYNSLTASGLALRAPAMQHLNARSDLAEISQRSGAGDLKVRVTNHSADAYNVPQIAVYEESTAVPMMWVSDTGWIYNGNASADESVAPYDAYLSTAVSVQKNIIMGQLQNEGVNSARLLNQGRMTFTGNNINFLEDVWLSTAGLTHKVAAASPVLTAGVDYTIAASKTFFVYYEASSRDIKAHFDASNITFSDYYAAGAAPYPTGGDVILGWFTTDAGSNVTSIGSSKAVARIDSVLPITVGTDGEANFSGWNSAVAFVRQYNVFLANSGVTSDFNFKYELRAISDTTVVTEIDLTDLDVDLVIDGGSHTHTWTPGGAARSFFKVENDVANVTIRNFDVFSSWAGNNGFAFLRVTPPGAGGGTLERIHIQSVREVGSSVSDHFYYQDGVGTTLVKKLHIEDVYWTSALTGIHVSGAAGTHYLGEYVIENFFFVAGDTAAAYGIYIHLVADALTQNTPLARREITGCHLRLDSNPAGGGDEFDYGILVGGPTADHTVIRDCSVYDYKIDGITLGAPNCSVSGKTLVDHTGGGTVSTGRAISVNATGCVVDGATVAGHNGALACIYLTSAGNSKILNTRVDQSSGSVGTIGVYVDGSVGCEVRGCTFVGRVGDAAEQAILANSSGTVVTSNTVTGWEAAGFGVIALTSATADYVVISNNSVDGTCNGPALSVTAAVDGLLATGNTFLPAEGNGITLANVGVANARISDNHISCAQDTGEALSVGAAVATLSITGNRFLNTNGTQTSNVVELDGAFVTFSGNHIEANGVSASALNMDAATLRAVISGNMFLNLASPQTVDLVTLDGTDVTFANNHLEVNGASNATSALGVAAAATRAKIRGNSFANLDNTHTAEVVRLDGGYTTFSDNSIDAPGVGGGGPPTTVALAVDQSATNTVICNNTIVSSHAVPLDPVVRLDGQVGVFSGNYVEGQSHDQSIVDVDTTGQEWAITGNTIVCTEQAAGANVPCLYAGGAQGTISGNVLSGLYDTVGREMLRVGGTKYVIIGNCFENNAGGQLYADAGGSSIYVAGSNVST